jgi:hypothetical protein
MQPRVYGIAVTITGVIFTIILSVYPDIVREFISKLFGIAKL